MKFQHSFCGKAPLQSKQIENIILNRKVWIDFRGCDLNNLGNRAEKAPPILAKFFSSVIYLISIQI